MTLGDGYDRMFPPVAIILFTLWSFSVVPLQCTGLGMLTFSLINSIPEFRGLFLFSTKIIRRGSTGVYNLLISFGWEEDVSYFGSVNQKRRFPFNSFNLTPKSNCQ